MLLTLSTRNSYALEEAGYEGSIPFARFMHQHQGRVLFF